MQEELPHRWPAARPSHLPKPLRTRRFVRPLGDESLQSAQPAKQFRTQRCRVGFFTLPSPVNQLPKVLISKSAASPLPDLGCPVAPFASERRHSGPRAGPVTSSVWRKSRASSGSCSQFRALWVGAGGARSTLPEHEK